MIVIVLRPCDWIGMGFWKAWILHGTGGRLDVYRNQMTIKMKSQAFGAMNCSYQDSTMLLPAFQSKNKRPHGIRRKQFSPRLANPLHGLVHSMRLTSR